MVRPDAPFVLTPGAILYEDETLIAVDKPVSLPTVPTADPSRPSLVRAVELFLAQAGRGRGPLGVHQRLDRDTSGVVLFAKDPSANPGLAEAFAKREVLKLYDVVTARPTKDPPPTFAIDRALVRRGRRGMAGVDGKGSTAAPGSERAPSVDLAPQPARTEFAVRETFARALLVEARPLTGRKHQIRVHLAEAGLPVLGDAHYGKGRGKAASAPRLMLHARRLALRHPVTGEPLAIESPWPEEFRRVIEQLRRSAAGKPEVRDEGGGRRPRPRSGRPRGPRTRGRGDAAGGRRTRR